MDEPDYNLRLEGFSDAKRLVTDGEAAVATRVDLILPVLHNALFFLSQVYSLSTFSTCTCTNT